MQDFAFTYQKISRGSTPGPPLDRLALRARVELRSTFTPPLTPKPGSAPVSSISYQS